MNLYQIYKNEQYTLLFRSVMYFLIGVGMLVVTQQLYYFPLLIFIPAFSNLYLSYSLKKELKKANRLYYENMPASEHSLIGVHTKEGSYYLKTNGWSHYFIQRTSMINNPKQYLFHRKHKLPLSFSKWSRTIKIDHPERRMMFQLKYQSATAIEWQNEGGDTILIYKGNKRWILNYQEKNYLSLQKGYLPQSVQRLFDSHHSYVSFYETYNEDLDWLLIFLWYVDSDYFLTS
ncbi:hypothetical protein [Rossellomorea vietnamensis]|uniref:Uncharacterized protein n=1 Tax=Rossellomorea vietnamensis TaxID=218284 RepID=A0A6I6USG5_9BACI|nr:hypothetical protein [Rossellomorea vietnamensis]QHE61862.1 hypothetical protein FHE72_13190 [Rossellomorea vietnamensis]